MRRWAVAFLVVFCAVFSVRAEAEEPKPPLRTTLVIGIVAFNPADDKKNDEKATTIDPMIDEYLRNVAQAASAAGAEIHFEVVRGNYYQVLRWMRDGTIDGALLSPFTYHVLLADSHPRSSIGVAKNAVLPVAVFQTRTLPHDLGELDGNAPMYRAVRSEAPGEKVDSKAVLDACVKELKDARSPGVQRKCRFSFVAHLSTTGFLYPLLHIDQLLEQSGIGEKHPKRVPDVMPRIMKSTEFVLAHKAEERTGTYLEFTYANALLNKAEETLLAAGNKKAARPGTRKAIEEEKKRKQEIRSFVSEAGWLHLFQASAVKEGAYSHFADDLIVISGVSTRAKELRQLPKFADGNGVWNPTGMTWKAKPVKYQRPIEYAWQTELHNDLDRDIERVFARRSTNPTWRRWYVEENYGFTVSELVRLLFNDQQVGGREEAAIVLPGGGVRGAYQAVVLDDLYKTHVVNIGHEKCADKKEKRLVISSIVGTSGGALMGFFAARKPFGIPLERRWVDRHGKAVVRPSQVFPFTGAMRWVSVLAAVLVLMVAAAMFWPHAKASGPPPRGVPSVLSIPIALLLFSAPFAIQRLERAEAHDLDPWSAGVFYFFLFLAVHAVHSILAPTGVSGSRGWLIGGLATSLAGIAMASAAIDREMAIATQLAILPAIGGLFMIAGWMGLRVSPNLVRQYAKGALLVAAFLAGTTLLFGIVWAIDFVTTIEMTGAYWIWVLLAAVVTSLVTVALHPLAIVNEALEFWFRLFRAKPFFYTPAATLIIGGFGALLSWLAFVAPALYTGGTGAKTFRQQAEAAIHHPASARFVAALTSFGPPNKDSQDMTFAPGDYYAVERDGKELPDFPRLLIYPKVDEKSSTPSSGGPDKQSDFLEAVIASGSPFPIYPGRKLSHRDSRGKHWNGYFVDGGFAHLVPIEGAVRMGAKQVLIVANKPYDEADDDDTTDDDSKTDDGCTKTEVKQSRTPAYLRNRFKSPLSLLVSDLPRTAGFLFDRAQIVDHMVQRDVVAATIAPTSSAAAPFLMDFTPKTINVLVCAARKDVSSRRPGRVASWGQPTVYLAPPAQAGSKPAQKK